MRLLADFAKVLLTSLVLIGVSMLAPPRVKVHLVFA
jgi:hypothetical protein